MESYNDDNNNNNYKFGQKSSLESNWGKKAHGNTLSPSKVRHVPFNLISTDYKAGSAGNSKAAVQLINFLWVTGLLAFPVWLMSTLYSTVVHLLGPDWMDFILY